MPPAKVDAPEHGVRERLGRHGSPRHGVRQGRQISPDAKWNGADAKANWDAIAKAKGIAAAKANDAAGVKAACKAYHDGYKDKYKAQYRTKAVP